jgi:tetrahydromethanopterin S-methyltransferase subunit A
MLDKEDEPTNATPEMSFERQEFYNWCDANEIDRNVEVMDEADRRDFERIAKRFCDAVKEKRIVVDGDNFIYTVSERSKYAGEKFTVTRPNGRAMLAMDGFKDTAQNQKMQAFMAAICGVEKRDIAKISTLDNKDYKVLLGVVILFLAD